MVEVVWERKCTFQVGQRQSMDGSQGIQNKWAHCWDYLRARAPKDRDSHWLNGDVEGLGLAKQAVMYYSLYMLYACVQLKSMCRRRVRIDPQKTHCPLPNSSAQKRALGSSLPLQGFQPWQSEKDYLTAYAIQCNENRADQKNTFPPFLALSRTGWL